MTNLIAKNINATIIELRWDPVNEIEQNGIILGYNVYYHLYNSSDPYLMVLNVTERVSGIFSKNKTLLYVCACCMYICMHTHICTYLHTSIHIDGPLSDMYAQCPRVSAYIIR